jgi:3-methyladenine DNA glycosylase AlkD
MMTLAETMLELEAMGEPNIKKILLNHGVKEPFFGVKVQNLKVLQKKIKVNYSLAKELYETGNADAMYLAGLVTDDAQMTKDDLNHWVQNAVSNNISEYTVPWVAAQGKYGWELGLQWIDSQEEHIASAGWNTLSNCLALIPDEKLDIPTLLQLIDRVIAQIHSVPNRVRATMNTFIISIGTYVVPLYEESLLAAQKIGKVTVIMDGTACKVPDAKTYINKVKDLGKQGKKKKMVKC